METNKDYFDVSKDVARLEDDPHEFMVELFSHDKRVQRVVHVDPKQDDEQDPNFISIRAEFQTQLPVPLKLRGPEWDVSLFQACFRNQRSAVYQVQFENASGQNDFQVNLPHRPYENAFELYEQVAQLSLRSEFQRPVLVATDGLFRITGGFLASQSSIGSQGSQHEEKWEQRCFNGPFLSHVPTEWYHRELLNPSFLWYHIIELWRTSSIQTTRKWIMNHSTFLPFWLGSQPFSNLFFWDHTDEAFRHYTLKSGESVDGGLPRQLDLNWWTLFASNISMTQNVDGNGYASFNIHKSYLSSSYFYMVVSKKLAELMNLDEMIRLNGKRYVKRFRVEYDDDMIMILMTIGMDLVLPQVMSVKTMENEDQPSIFLFQEKGVVQYYLRKPSLYLPPTNSNGRSVMVQSGYLEFIFNQKQWLVRSFPERLWNLWKADAFGKAWDLRQNFIYFFGVLNQNLPTSREDRLNDDTIKTEFKLLGNDYLGDESEWPKVLVYEYTAGEIRKGHYVLKENEMLPSGQDMDHWQGQGQQVLQVYGDGTFEFKNPFGRPYRIFWIMLSKEVAFLFNLERWVLDFFPRNTSRWLAWVPWDTSKVVIYWFNFIQNEFPIAPSIYALQTRHFGVSKINPSLNSPILNEDDDTIQFFLVQDTHYKTFSVLEPHQKLVIIDKQFQIILKKEHLTSHYFQPWFQPGYVGTIVLSIPELEVRDVLLSYDPKTGQWVLQKEYQCFQPFILSQKQPLVMFEGGASKHAIKLRERQDGGLHTLTVVLKSLDGTRSPAFYNGISYIALYFCDRRFYKK